MALNARAGSLMATNSSTLPIDECTRGSRPSVNTITSTRRRRRC
jgi:hypothetical protein